jgi:hypothetical protein
LDYKKDNPYNFPAVNKKEIDMMKGIMSEFVGLRSKVHAYLKEGEVETKAKKKLIQTLFKYSFSFSLRSCLVKSRVNNGQRFRNTTICVTVPNPQVFHLLFL